MIAAGATGAIGTLQRAGIVNPRRLAALVADAVERFALDLSGLTVLTEAASGPFVVTPVIAAMAGAARVIAVTRDSAYASADAVIEQTRALEVLCGRLPSVDIFASRSPALFAEADVVTNLGFVRPIDARAVAVMKRSAVVPLMCEAWEYRPGDVDLAACRAGGVTVCGTNEDFSGLDVFANSGPVCMKLLLDAQIEVYKSSIVVVSRDKFGAVLQRYLAGGGASVRLIPSLRDLTAAEGRSVDAIVVADYTRDLPIIGSGGDVTVGELQVLAPSATVIQFAGAMDVPALRAAGYAVHPGVELPARRMALTLGAIGPRPVIELHTAGLKVGQLLAGGAPADGPWQDLLQPIC